LTAFLIYRLLVRWLDRRYALLGVLLFLTLPVIVKLSISVYVDLGLICFTTAALHGLVRWMESGLQTRYLVLAAVATGLALGTKYNALVVFCLLFLSVPFLRLRYRAACAAAPAPVHRTGDQSRAVRSALVFGVIALLLYAPWGVRNLIWTGNPVYPLYDTLFDKLRPAQTRAAQTSNDELRELYNSSLNLDHFSIRQMVFQEQPLDIALIPLRIFFQGQDDNPRYFDGRLHPLLFFLPFLALIGIRREPPARRIAISWLLGFAWLFILLAFCATDMRIRYIGPALPPLVVLSAVGLQRLIDLLNNRAHNPLWGSFLAIAFVALVMTPNLFYLNSLFRQYFPVAYLRGQVDRAQYIEHFRPEYAALRFGNQNLPTDARILFVFGGNRSYYSDRDIYFNNPLFKDLIISSTDSEALRQSLKAMGFTHLLLNHPLFAQWMVPSLDAAAQRRVTALFDERLQLLFAKNGFALYRL
jgi:4-amino-4-deoxy-L-arabinose transferase-like glycosyltransferase